MKKIVLSDTQRPFVTGKETYSAYIGGLGSGKTFAGILRGLNFASQSPGAKGLFGAISYRILKDVVYPEFWKIVDGTGLVAPDGWKKSDDKVTLKNGSEILFRSLDDPDRVRGVEISWFFVDEGRHLRKNAWDILVGRLRQPGYQRGGWVSSTPNGYDWMWQLFHPDSPNTLTGAEWYNASTHDNPHLPIEYKRDLEAQYEGKWYEQEVLGRFVGIMRGAVFPHWDQTRFIQSVPYDPALPLYSFWDFGVGELGVVLFAQIAWLEKELSDGSIEYVPQLRFVGAIEAKDWGIKEWAQAWHDFCQDNFDGRLPDSNWGDPAGKQRNVVSGTTTLDALWAAGVPVRPAPKRAPDAGLIILDNMMAGGRVVADDRRCFRLAAAFSTHRWNVDDQGNRTGTRPVHDWTSHYCDAAKYGAVSLLSLFRRRTKKEVEQRPPKPNEMGFIMNQLLGPKNKEWLGPQGPDGPVTWEAPTIPVRS